VSRGSGGAPARVVERRKEGEAMLHGGMGKRSREGLLGKLYEVPRSNKSEFIMYYSASPKISSWHNT
jgi:hypothetical protein